MWLVPWLRWMPRGPGLVIHGEIVEAKLAQLPGPELELVATDEDVDIPVGGPQPAIEQDRLGDAAENE